MKTEALRALKKNVVKRVRETGSLDTAPNAMQLMLDQALYLPEEGGIVAVVALVNPTEQAEQVIGATIEITDPDGGEFVFPASSIPSTLPALDIPAWCSAFPVRIAAIEALIGQMYFISDSDRSMTGFERVLDFHGPLRAVVHFMTLKSGILNRECRVVDVGTFAPQCKIWPSAFIVPLSAGIPGTGLSVRNYAKKGNPEAVQYQNAALIGVVVALGIILVLAIIAMSQQ